MVRATARHILVDTQEICDNLKSQIENGADFSELARPRESYNCDGF